ncbi:MAG: adenylosuccinate synthetase, partial [Acidobacteriota bacterium]|nr:adenylosuccinate synthetase [Acidobacteriota bacterium]
QLDQSACNSKELFEKFTALGKNLKPHLANTSVTINRLIQEGKNILFEGAQGSLLDIDHGTYPFVTSSNSTAGGACTGLGVSPDKIDGVLGVTKAYTTRVGMGPFPTEIFNEKGKLLLERGNEFGATTGRPRRCGWFDAVILAYSCRLSGIKKIALTKSDILDGFEEVLVCVGYKYKGEMLETFPTESWVLEKVKPQYRTLRGWKKPVKGVTDFTLLPEAFLDYIKIIEELIQVKISIISTGMAREDTILIDKELKDIVNIEKVRKGIKE